MNTGDCNAAELRMRAIAYLLALLVISGTGLRAATNPATSQPVTDVMRFPGSSSLHQSLVQKRDEARFVEDVREWLRLPPYLHSGIATTLLEYLDGGPRPLDPPYPPPLVPGELGLRTVQQRAVWALQQLTGQDLPLERVGDDPAATAWREEVVAIVTAYHDGAFDASARLHRESREPVNLAQYRGRIREGIHDQARDHAQLFANVLDQWEPIGRPPGGLLNALGLTGEPEGDDVIVTFDTGWGGIGFRLHVRQGLIWAVTIR